MSEKSDVAILRRTAQIERRTAQIERQRRIRNDMQMCKLREWFDQRVEQREKRSRDR